MLTSWVSKWADTRRVETGARCACAVFAEIRLDTGASYAHFGMVSRLIAATEYRYLRAEGGTVHCPTGVHAYPFWSRYLDVFDEIVVVMRLFDGVCRTIEAPLQGPGVSFAALPAYEGPTGLFRRAPDIYRALHGLVRPDDVVLARAPGIFGTLLAEQAMMHGRPFGVEVLADPRAVFASTAIRHPGAPIFREAYTRALTRQCQHAAAAAYVTEGALQALYPPGRQTYAVACSDVELQGHALVDRARTYECGPQPAKIVTVGTLEQPYKGIDVLLDAVGRLHAEGHRAQLTVVGEGRLRQTLEEQCGRLGIRDAVTFTGLLQSGGAVREKLDAADLFVLPSRTEGLPRALVEAMARALPCVASAVGGVPELLAAEHLVPAGDSGALATALASMVASPARLEAASRKNLERARQFGEAERRRRHVGFLRHLRSASEVQRSWW